MESKKKKILALLFLLILTGFGFWWYHSRNRKKFLFVGDSQTDYIHSYVDQFKELNNNFEIKKISKIGSKTDWMLSELKKDLQENKYGTITIWGGSNDIFAYTNLTEAKKNLTEMFLLVKKSGAKLKVISPVNKSFYSATKPIHQQLIKELEEWLGNQNEIDELIIASTMTRDISLFQSDKLHLNEKGHKIILNNWIK